MSRNILIVIAIILLSAILGIQIYTAYHSNLCTTMLEDLYPSDFWEIEL